MLALETSELDVEIGVDQEVVVTQIAVEDAVRVDLYRRFSSLDTPNQTLLERYIWMRSKVGVQIAVSSILKKKSVCSEFLGSDNMPMRS